MTTLPAFARGRASRSNSSGRYDAFTRGAFDDGWADSDPQPERRDTTLTAEKARMKTGGASVAEIVRLTGICRASVYRIVDAAAGEGLNGSALLQ